MKLMKLVVVVAMVTVSQLSFAAGATKIGVLNVQAVILGCDVGKAGMAELEKNAEFIAMKAKFENVDAEIKVLSEKEKTDGLTWSDEQKAEHQKKIMALAQEGQALGTQLNRGQESFFMQLSQALKPGMGKATEEVMAAEGIDLIINREVVVLAMPTADITEMVIKKLNEINTQAAAAAQKAKK